MLKYNLLTNSRFKMGHLFTLDIFPIDIGMFNRLCSIRNFNITEVHYALPSGVGMNNSKRIDVGFKAEEMTKNVVEQKKL